MNHTVVIVDDEAQHSDYLKGLLEKNHSSYHILAVCHSVDEAISTITRLQPDLVFLDVLMHPKTGFDVLENIDREKIGVIFTTSFESFALKALKLSAIDYLLKPFGGEDLAEALDKFEKHRSALKQNKNLDFLLEVLQDSKANKVDKIALPVANGYKFVSLADIVRMESVNSYTVVFVKMGGSIEQVVTSKSIKECEELLDDVRFFIPHRSHLINLEFIKSYEKGDGGVILMEDETSVDLSRRKKDEFFERLKRL
ncbi:MAG: LytTR family DNA-binding domain-containing protein [Flavobacteriales bacterium]